MSFATLVVVCKTFRALLRMLGYACRALRDEPRMVNSTRCAEHCVLNFPYGGLLAWICVLSRAR